VAADLDLALCIVIVIVIVISTVEDAISNILVVCRRVALLRPQTYPESPRSLIACLTCARI
jgi:hypothetical protein